MKIFEGPLAHLEHALDIRSERHAVLSGNVAQIDTPGYVARDVDFDASFEDALRADASGQEASVQVQDAQHLHSTTLDGNTVDLDRTMAALAENGRRSTSPCCAPSSTTALASTLQMFLPTTR
jgi:flagellar basal-body rod protein FlgB